MEQLQFAAKEWESTGKKRLKEVEKILESGKYAVEEQKQLAKLDKELAKLGYDAPRTMNCAPKGKVNCEQSRMIYANLKSAKEVSRQIESEIAKPRSKKSKIVNRKSKIWKENICCTIQP
jgi:hypothetical protein